MSITITTEGLRWFDDSPAPGDPACLCSHCGQLITAGVPIRMWRTPSYQEARFHDACFSVRAGVHVSPQADVLDVTYQERP